MSGSTGIEVSSATLGGEAGYLYDPWDRGYGSLQCSTRRPLSLCRWNVLIVSIAEGISIPVSFKQAWHGRAAVEEQGKMAYMPV
jgi:hypothetical protein